MLIIPLTIQQDALRFPGTLLVEPDEQNRLPRPSAALVFQLTAVDQRHLKERLGNLPEPVMDAIWEVFGGLTGRSNAR